jgi:hypothetical protein
MIEYFNAPERTVKNTVITKKMFSEQTKLTTAEKRLLKEDILAINMRIVLQPQTIGMQTYETDDYQYNQIVISEVVMNKRSNFVAVSKLLQQAFPYPLIVLLRFEAEYLINWADKRINQVDKSKRVVESMEYTRWINTANLDELTEQFLDSLDITRGKHHNLYELFESMKSKFAMLAVADQIGRSLDATPDNIELYRMAITELANNREEQKGILQELKTETQFNAKLELNKQLKQLQVKERKIKLRLEKIK